MKISGEVKALIVCITQGILYLLQFCLVPIFIFPTIHDNLLSWIVLATTTILVIPWIMYRYVEEFRYWIIGIILHYGLIHLYCPIGLYGLHYKDQIFGYMGTPFIITVPIMVLVIEVFIWIIIKVIKMVHEEC